MAFWEPGPTRDEVEQWFIGLIDGTRSRDEADRWAARWIVGGGPVDDDVVWWALGILHGIDLPAGPDAGWLHDDTQLRVWLDELRHRSSIG